MQYSRNYIYPNEYVLVTLNDFKDTKTNPLIPLLFKFTVESFLRYKNGNEVISQAISPNDWGDLLKSHINIEKISIADEGNIDLLLLAFDKFGVNKTRLEVVRLVDDDFFGCWWYGNTNDFIFLCNHETFAQPLSNVVRIASCHFKNDF